MYCNFFFVHPWIWIIDAKPSCTEFFNLNPKIFGQVWRFLKTFPLTKYLIEKQLNISNKSFIPSIVAIRHIAIVYLSKWQCMLIGTFQHATPAPKLFLLFILTKICQCERCNFVNEWCIISSVHFVPYLTPALNIWVNSTEFQAKCFVVFCLKNELLYFFNARHCYRLLWNVKLMRVHILLWFITNWIEKHLNAFMYYWPIQSD